MDVEFPSAGNAAQAAVAPLLRKRGAWKGARANLCSTSYHRCIKSLDISVFVTIAAAVVLSAEDLHEIDTAASQITVQGARYPARLQQLVGR